MTPDGRCETLEEAWREAGQRFSNEVRQEAAKKALEAGGDPEHQISCFFTECYWLSKRGHTDGFAGHRVGRAKQVREAPAASLLVFDYRGADHHTPEKELLIRELLDGLDLLRMQGLVEGYEPRKNTQVCSRGHEGATILRRKPNGGLSRKCKVCENDLLKVRRHAAKAGIM